MNSRTLITIVVIVLVVLGGYFLLSNKAAAPEPTPETPTEENSVLPIQNETITVSYTDSGFSPLELSVKVGDTVRFVNNSGIGMWVGADEHPTHTSYDGTATREHCVDGAAVGGTFDACRQVAAGSSWEFTFTKAGTFSYHNHARASHGGTVVVSE